MTTADATRCPYCLAELVSEDDPVVRCAVCLTAHHQACFAEHSRCTILGCAGVTTAAQDAPAPRVGAALHPLLAWGKQRIRRAASFLSVSAPAVERKRHHGQGRTLRLTLPPTATLGQPLEATLVAYTPRPVSGQGLRLVISSSLLDGTRRHPMSRMEGVVAGRPHRDWLSKMKLWRRPPDQLLLSPGTTTFRLNFDPTPFAWHGLLPDDSDASGPVLLLEVHAELEAGRTKKTSPTTLRLLDGRRGPPSLTEADRLDPAEPIQGVELSAPQDAFSARPIVHARPDPERWVLVGTAAAHHHSHAPQAPPAAAIDLCVAPLAKGERVVRGEVTLGLTRVNFAGQLLVEVEAEREGYVRGTKRWRACAREQVLLALGSAPAAYDVSGTHTIAFELPLPACLFGGKPSDARRVRLRAVARGQGLPLSSETQEIKVVGSRGTSRRRRNR